jgi:NADPH-dependent ferric siderophore reductase
MRQIELVGPDLPRLRIRPGAHLVVRIPAGDGHARRVYSIRTHDPRVSALTIRVAVHHRDGPGCAWARTAAPGDRVAVEPPRSKITLDETAAFHLFVGEETAAVPLLAMRAALHRSARGGIAPPALGVFEAAGPGDEVPGIDGVPALPWVHRGMARATASRVLLRAVQALDLPGGAGAGAHRDRHRSWEQVGGGRIGERGGDQQDRLVAGPGPIEDAGGRRRVAADELTDQPVRVGLGHASSVGSGAGDALTLG